jgi:hypothetical protein
MTAFEGLLFVVFLVVVAMLIVKVYEWRQDVLYGPYIGPTDQPKKPRFLTSRRT